MSDVAEPGLTARAPDTAIPLVVDVDGTLIKTDLLHETTMQFLARYPFEAWRLPLWLAGGRERLKCELADRIELDVETLPLRAETLSQIRTAQDAGRPVYLASASERGLVTRLAARIGGIAGVFATDRASNVAGANKAAQLVATFGAKGFDYIGDRPVDFRVWPDARRPIVVSHGEGFARRARRQFPDAEIISNVSLFQPRAMLRAMRPHQWAKNMLVFLPLIAGHQLDPDAGIATVLAFVCFCLAASSSYIINDLLDLPGDRTHVRKRKRPFAAGDVPIAHGVVLSVLLMAVAVGVAATLPGRFLFVLAGYVALTFAYSLLLKRKLLVDIIVLGGLYTIRVFGGIESGGQQQSQWLLMFSLFLFLSLASVKRCSELVAARESGRAMPAGRGYRAGDLDVLFPLAAASGYGAVLVTTLYMSSPEVMRLYAHPLRMWLICPLLLYWISRVLVLSSRNELHDDPVVFALTDRVSWVTGALIACVIFVSI